MIIDHFIQTILSSVGSAYCECPEGFEIGDDNQTCQDINEVSIIIINQYEQDICS